MRTLTVNKFQIKLPALFRFDLGILTGKKLRNSTQTLPETLRPQTPREFTSPLMGMAAVQDKQTHFVGQYSQTLLINS